MLDFINCHENAKEVINNVLNASNDAKIYILIFGATFL